jgi:hypothetical protein
MLISAIVFCLAQGSVVNTVDRDWDTIAGIDTGVLDPLVNERSVPLDTVLPVVRELSLFWMVAAIGYCESMIAIETDVPALAILTLVPRTPATRPPPPRLTPVLVRIRPQSLPSERIA